MNNLLRWLLVVPAALLVWYAMIYIGLAFEAYAKQELCRPIELESVWHCVTDHQFVRIILEKQLLSSTFFVLSAAPVIFVSVAMAPNRKVLASWSAWLLGSMIALGFAVFPPFLNSSLCAVALGLLCAVASTVYHRRGDMANAARVQN